MYAFDDFVTTWADKLKSKAKDPVVLYLRDELEKYKLFAPLLRHVRGDAFTTDHWHQLYKVWRYLHPTNAHTGRAVTSCIRIGRAPILEHNLIFFCSS